MERIMKAQTLGSMHSLMGGGDKKIMEINPKHPLIRKLHSDAELSEDIVTNTIHVMYDTALMLSGYSHEDPSVFSDRIFRMLSAGLQIDDTVEEEAPVVPEASQTTEEEGEMEQLD
jgi:molecular chaperone HtpG